MQISGNFGGGGGGPLDCSSGGDERLRPPLPPPRGPTDRKQGVQTFAKLTLTKRDSVTRFCCIHQLRLHPWFPRATQLFCKWLHARKKEGPVQSNLTGVSVRTDFRFCYVNPQYRKDIQFSPCRPNTVADILTLCINLNHLNLYLNTVITVQSTKAQHGRKLSIPYLGVSSNCRQNMAANY